MFLVFSLGFGFLWGLVNSSFFLGLLSVVLVFLLFSVSFSQEICFFVFGYLDKTSYFLTGLTIWFGVILVLVGVKYLKMPQDFVKFKVNLLLLVFLLMMTFLLKDLLGFYVLFELSLLPLMYLIMSWGYQVERVQAVMYLFFYTLTGSLPLFIVILFLYLFKGLDSWFLLKLTGDLQCVFSSFVLCCVVLVAFSVKLPLYLLHLWLPKAHVEAPAAGSMILAGVLLKVSGYGFIRVLLCMKGFFSYSFFVVTVSFFGALVSAFICTRQSDLKSLVAYSSISHMGVMMGSVFFFSPFSLEGALVIMLSHGFCSSALFFLLNFHYERSISRQVVLVRGQSVGVFAVVIFWFLFLVVNFAVPPFLSLFGEILVMFVCSVVSVWLWIILGFSSFMVAYYCLYFYSSVLHGHTLKHEVFVTETELVYLLLSMHFFPLCILILKLNLFFF